MRIVIALGGNALLRRGEPLEAEVQRRNLAAAAEVLAAIASTHQVVITHGNGPQVGLLALQAEALAEPGPYPLDILGAESEGMVGYLIEQQLAPRLAGRDVCTLLTQVEVAPDDDAFDSPSKPIGPLYDEETVERLAAERGWRVAPDGPGWRRVVPSPRPIRILEEKAIRLLLESGSVVICAGGGGVPVVVEPSGAIRGVEAVIDKDLTAALLGHMIDADALLLLTDVAAVELDWNTPRARPIREATPDRLREYAFEPGSMGPKVEAACNFVEGGGAFAVIGALEDAERMLEGRAGTRVTPGSGLLKLPES